MFEKTWESRNEKYPFTVYLKSVCKLRNDAWEAQKYLEVKKFDLLLSLLYDVLDADLKSNSCAFTLPHLILYLISLDFDSTVLTKYYGIIPESDNSPKQWESLLKSWISIVCLQVGKFDNIMAASWISKVIIDKVIHFCLIDSPFLNRCGTLFH